MLCIWLMDLHVVEKSRKEDSFDVKCAWAVL